MSKFSKLPFSIIFLTLILSLCYIISGGTKIDSSFATYGWENGFLAANLLLKGSFSSPFKISGASDPNYFSAWMPPGLAFIQASIFLFFGIYTKTSAIILLILKILSLVFSVNLLANCFNNINKKIFIISFAVFWILLPEPLHRFENDMWFSILFTAIAIYFIFNYQNKIPTILVSLILPLTNPQITFAYLLTVSVKLIKNKQKLFYLYLLPIILTSIFWLIRNTNSIEMASFSKSNMFFEFYLANVKDSDGILSSSNFYQEHPILNLKIQNQYYNLGEKEFLNIAKLASYQWLFEHPKEYLNKILNRAKNIFLLTAEPSDSVLVQEFKITDDAKEYLIKQKLLLLTAQGIRIFPINYKNYLISSSELASEELEQIKSIFERAEQTVLAKNRAIIHIIRGLIFGIIPLLALLILCYFKAENYKLFVIFYFSYLLPYLLISHYARYQYAFCLVQFLLIYLALEQIYNNSFLKRSKA